VFLQQISDPKEIGLDRVNGHGENVSHRPMRSVLSRRARRCKIAIPSSINHRCFSRSGGWFYCPDRTSQQSST